MNHSNVRYDDVIGFVSLILFLAAAYLIPSIIAVARKHKNTAAIAVVNITLGWTFLGYIFALVWSLTNSDNKGQIVINQISHQPPPFPPPVSPQFLPVGNRNVQLLSSHAPEPRVIDVDSVNQNRSLKSQLEELKELHDAGLVSEEEYQAKRSSLLS